MSESCKQCNRFFYHGIKTDRKEQGVEIIHHSTASVIQINFYSDSGGYEIQKSEHWMDYEVFKKLHEEINSKADCELNWLLKK